MQFRFDESKDFSANFERFLAHMEGKDAEMGAILRAYVQSLLPATDDAARRGARAVFNLGVTPELDKILERSLKKDTG
jgi:hypothetical protein